MSKQTGIDRLSTAHGEIAFLRSGSGPAVVIIHGIGGHKEDWQGLMTALSPRHTVYAVDMLGFGGSAKAAAVITIADQVDAVRALLDANGIASTDMVGNSVGGWVAATFAASHPDRARKLVLVDAAGFKAMFDGPPPVNFYPQDLADMEKLLSIVRFDPAAHTKEFAEKALAGTVSSGDARAADAVGKGMFASTRLEDVADKVASPTLVIWGAEDKLFPPSIADIVTGHIKQSRKVLIASASHFPQLDNAAEFNRAVVSFLDP